YVLIDEDRVAVGVDDDEARGSRRGLVGGGRRLDAETSQLALKLADVGELGELVAGRVPAGVEGQDVALEHALKQADRRAAVLQDQPVLRLVAAANLEAEGSIECERGGEILDREAHGEIAQIHG